MPRREIDAGGVRPLRIGENPPVVDPADAARIAAMPASPEKEAAIARLREAKATVREAAAGFEGYRGPDITVTTTTDDESGAPMRTTVSPAPTDVPYAKGSRNVLRLRTQADAERERIERNPPPAPIPPETWLRGFLCTLREMRPCGEERCTQFNGGHCRHAASETLGTEQSNPRDAPTIRHRIIDPRSA